MNTKKSQGKRIKKREPIPHLFGKSVVVWCLGFSTIASAYSLYILHRTGHDASGLLVPILTFFLGELVVFCLKTILSIKKANKKEN